MQAFPILVGAYKGKQIRVPYYLETNHGVELTIDHNLPSSTGRFRWVQTVFENGEIARKCGRASYVDPLKPTGKKDQKTYP